MASDVTDEEEDGRYRGFDIEDDPEEDNEPASHSECTTTTSTTKATEYPKTVDALQQTVEKQAEQIKKLQEQLARYTKDTEDNESQSKKRKRINCPNNGKDINAVTNADTSDKEVIQALTEENALLKDNLMLISQKLAEATDLKHKDNSDKPTEAETTRILNSLPLKNIGALFQEMQMTMTKEVSKMNESMKEVKEWINEKSSDATKPQSLPVSLINEFKDVMGTLLWGTE